MLRDGDRPKRVDGTPAGDDDGKMVVVDATRFPEPSRMMSPGKTSSPKSLATAFGISAALGS